MIKKIFLIASIFVANYSFSMGNEPIEKWGQQKVLAAVNILKDFFNEKNYIQSNVNSIRAADIKSDLYKSFKEKCYEEDFYQILTMDSYGAVKNINKLLKKIDKERIDCYEVIYKLLYHKNFPYCRPIFKEEETKTLEKDLKNFNFLWKLYRYKTPEKLPLFQPSTNSSKPDAPLKRAKTILIYPDIKSLLPEISKNPVAIKPTTPLNSLNNTNTEKIKTFICSHKITTSVVVALCTSATVYALYKYKKYCDKKKLAAKVKNEKETLIAIPNTTIIS